MTDSLTNPGDVLEGQGLLLQHGRLITHVDYHLTIPTQTHFFLNPTGNLNLDYKNHAVGFILLTQKDAETLSLDEYTLELSDKSKRNILVKRRYKEVKRKGETKISFWVKIK